MKKILLPLLFLFLVGPLYGQDQQTVILEELNKSIEQKNTFDQIKLKRRAIWIQLSVL